MDRFRVCLLACEVIENLSQDKVSGVGVDGIVEWGYHRPFIITYEVQEIWKMQSA